MLRTTSDQPLSDVALAYSPATSRLGTNTSRVDLS